MEQMKTGHLPGCSPGRHIETENVGLSRRFLVSTGLVIDFGVETAERMESL